MFTQHAASNIYHNPAGGEASLCLKSFHMGSISSFAKGHRSVVTLTSAQEPQLISGLGAVDHAEEFNRINVALYAC